MSKSDFDYNLVDSILIIKASDRSIKDANSDLDLTDGQSIADLLDDKKNIAKNNRDEEEDCKAKNRATEEN